ncbi:MAG TPA: LacI family DNA-binding transcriptional regulator [Opitutaceae bacterium]|nr:LacI family DNA-binding transcriptional regulator [Opitutaceae bacterium]HPG16729.1 LacI family DNA-binding transcriptional regulator [Opitutaceae bacterium]
MSAARINPRAATLADVGRAAGVSAMAASAVLNQAKTSSRISPDTRARILAAAAKLNYRPNVAARALAARRMNTIGLAAVVDLQGELNHYFMEVLNGVIEAAARYDQNTTVFTLHDWHQEASRVGGFCDGRIDGLILLAPLMSEAQGRQLPLHTPFVALHANTPLPSVVNIESDEEAGFYNLVSHLIGLGHRRILLISGELSFLGAQRRKKGYLRALADAGIAPDPELQAAAGSSVDSGRLSLKQWLATHAGQPLPEAIVCYNDSVAFGCLEVLAESGVRVPQDVSVAGFDDTLAARTTVPQLTTVRQPLREMGQRAVEVLLKRIGHAADAAATPVVFPTELILRASVGVPRTQVLRA